MTVPARLWYSRMLQAAPSTASPRNTPQVRTGAGPADRVLLLGNGVLHGWGVQLRELAVPGHLSQLLHARTGRAVIVDYVGEERMNAASAVAWLGDAAARGHDLAVIGIGLNDALRLTPVAQFQQHMTELVERVLAAQGPHAVVVLIGIPHVRAFAMADSAMGSMAQRHADQLDAVLQQIAATSPAVAFVAAPEERFEADRPLGSPAMYRSWAEQLLPHLIPRLDGARAATSPPSEHSPRYSWSGSAAALEADGLPAQQRLDALTEQVRARFQVASVGVNLVDDGQVHSLAGRSGAPRQMPRSLAYCDRTVTRDAPTLVEDRAEDPDFADNPFLDLVGLPFYAGVPLHASDGTPVATLCLLDTAPRTDIDPTDLQQYAAEAEALLRTFEPGHPDAPGSAAMVSGALEEAGTAPPEEQDSLGLRLAAAALRPALHLILRSYLQRQARPHWDQRAISPGPDPLRVLIFGAGIAVGYGSDGADHPWPAQIGAALTAATGRGVIVETRARPSVPLEHCLDLLGRAGAATFDHIIWSPTLEEATSGNSRRWTRQLRRITTHVHTTAPTHRGLVLLGLTLVNGDHPAQRISRILGRAVNTRIAAVAACDPRTSHLPLPNQTVPDYDSPLFDTAYREQVTDLLVHHLLTGKQHRPARAADVTPVVPEPA